jgi:PAS domain S-box-containing protein
VLRAGAHDYILREHSARLIPAIQRELRNAESRRARTRAEKVRDALFKFSQATQQSLTLEQLLGIIHKTISELMPADNIYIALYDELTDTLSFPYYVDEYDEAPPPTKPGRGLTEYILRSGKSVLASPELFEELVRKDEVELIGSPSIDWMGVPLKIGEQVFGVLAIQSYTEGIRYRKEDIDILTFASDQIALAINRMRSEQELIEEVAFRKTIEVSVLAGIFAIDRDGRQTYVNPAFCRMVGWSEDELSNAIPPFKYWPDEEIENIQEAFRITTGEDALPSDFELRFQRENGERFDAYLLISPLKDSNAKVTGWLASVYDITERKNTEAAIQRQTKRAEDLARMAEKLNARLNLQQVLDTICTETTKALNVPAAAVLLFDREVDAYHIAAATGLPTAPDPHFNVPPSSLLASAGSAMHSPAVVQVDLQDTPDVPGFLVDVDARSMALVNMLRDGGNIGNLVVFSIGEQRNFANDDLSLLHGLANLGEQAIVNARLFEETERRLEQVHALHAIDLAISASLDINVTLNILLDHVISLLRIDAADILLYNAYSQKLDYAVGRGFRSMAPTGTRLRTGGGFASQAVLERRLIFIDDLTRTIADPSTPAMVRDEGFVSYLACPLIARGLVKGVLEIYHRVPIRLNSEWRSCWKRYPVKLRSRSIILHCLLSSSVPMKS